MRDWNQRNQPGKAGWAHGFQHTYEGLKLAFAQHVASGPVHVFSIPMRDWNSKRIGGPLLQMWVFSIPMRDWNNTIASTVAEIIIVFSIPMRDWNITFSSPSRRARSRFSAYLWGIETRINYLSGDDVQSFQHTYEGLKRCSSDTVTPNVATFSAYLWGIETCQIQKCTSCLRLVFSIPMRDWNRVEIQQKRRRK